MKETEIFDKKLEKSDDADENTQPVFDKDDSEPIQSTHSKPIEEISSDMNKNEDVRQEQKDSIALEDCEDFTPSQNKDSKHEEADQESIVKNEVSKAHDSQDELKLKSTDKSKLSVLSDEKQEVINPLSKINSDTKNMNQSSPEFISKESDYKS